MTGPRATPGPWFTVWHIALMVPFAALAVASRGSIRDNSFLWHVQAGAVQTDLGRVLVEDPFSFVALGEPWRTQSWLVELVYSRLHEAFGLNFVPVMLVIVGWLTFAALGLIAFDRSRSVFATSMFLVLSFVILVGFMNPRPVLFSFALFALVVLSDLHRKLWWTIPLVIWIWSASHGSFVLGGLYLVLRAVQTRSWARFRVAVLSGVASLLTAHGWGVVSTLVHFFEGREALDVIREWATPDLVSAPFAPFLLLLLLLPVAARRDELQLRDMVLVAPFVVVGLTANRSMPGAWIALSTVAMATIGVPPFVRASVSPTQHRVNRVLAGAILLISLIAVPLDVDLDESRFPVEPLAVLEGERLFHDDAAGGFLIYASWPDRLIYVDDRAELFKTELPRMVEVRGGRPVWREAFAEWEFDEALLSPQDPLREFLTLGGWANVYEDEDWVVLRPGD